VSENMSELRTSALNALNDRVARAVVAGMSKEEAKRDLDYVLARTSVTYLNMGGSFFHVAKEFGEIVKGIDDMLDEAYALGAVED